MRQCPSTPSIRSARARVRPPHRNAAETSATPSAGSHAQTAMGAAPAVRTPPAAAPVAPGSAGRSSRPAKTCGAQCMRSCSRLRRPERASIRPRTRTVPASTAGGRAALDVGRTPMSHSVDQSGTSDVMTAGRTANAARGAALGSLRACSRASLRGCTRPSMRGAIRGSATGARRGTARAVGPGATCVDRWRSAARTTGRRLPTGAYLRCVMGTCVRAGDGADAGEFPCADLRAARGAPSGASASAAPDR